MTLKNNRAPLLSNIKLCASFHHHMWIQTEVTVQKWLSGVMTSVTFPLDLWPWPLAWTSLLSIVITPENVMMIWWQEHSERSVTDRQTDGQRDRKKCSWSCLVAAKNTQLIYVQLLSQLTHTLPYLQPSIILLYWQKQPCHSKSHYGFYMSVDCSLFLKAWLRMIHYGDILQWHHTSIMASPVTHHLVKIFFRLKQRNQESTALLPLGECYQYMSPTKNQ